MYNNHLYAFVIYLYVIKIVIIKIKTEGEGERESIGIGIDKVHSVYSICYSKPKNLRPIFEPTNINMVATSAIVEC